MRLEVHEFVQLFDELFDSNWPGYKPEVQEAPHGDGRWDTQKRYAHFTLDYLQRAKGENRSYLGFHTREIFLDAVEYAQEIAAKLGVPRAFWPHKQYSALRVLEYPSGAGSATHTDFDLFTLPLYDNGAGRFWRGEGLDVSLHPVWNTHRMDEIHKGLHIGELMPKIIPQAAATPHGVRDDRTGRTRFSCVFFAIPDHKAVLPSGTTVGDWIEERKARSRRTENED